MGCDFAYQNALTEFDSIQEMMDYINLHNTANIKLVWSTPSDYVNAVKQDNIAWPVKYDDGFPYADDDDEYWTGYFSSRPSSKKKVKDSSAIMNGEEKIFSQRVIAKNVSDEEVSKIMTAKKDLLINLGINLHHDAITGTAKHYVAVDYSNRLDRALA
jgi:hypothetical protein